MERSIHLELGSKLKQERIRRGLTLKEIEARVGISATHLSDVERGKSSPTVGVLEKIAQALGTRAALLVEMASGPPLSITRKGSRRAVLTPDGSVRSESLSESFPGAEISLLFKTYDLAPGRNVTQRAHEGEEIIHVIDGRLRVTVGSSEYTLDTGDTIHFKSIQPHSFENIGEGKCVCMLATCPRYTL